MIRQAAMIALMATTLILLASQVSIAQFIETGLPGSAFAGVVPAPNGRFYGVTYDGGTSNMGTLYSVDASLLNPPVVHVNFNGSNGKTPYDELTWDPVSAKFYGTTDSGGVNDIGTIFSYTPGASSVTTIKDNFSFATPLGPLVVSGGHIFGTLTGVSAGIFRMATDGTGYVVLHNFPIFNTLPQPVTLGADGWLYGVTLYGGLNCNPSFPSETCSTVFRLRRVLPTDPNQDEQFETLYQVTSNADRGLQRTVTYGSDGLIYFNHHRRIYRLNPTNPAATFQMIWEEPGGSISMSVIEGSDNRLYVASYDNNQSLFAGSVFSLNRDGTDKQILRTFSFTLGSRAYGPYGRLYRSPSGIVYGTTEYTISPGAGTVFAIGTGSNVPPVLGNVTATSPVTEGSSTTLSGTITDANPSDTFALTVNWGDGSTPQVFNYAAGTTSFVETHQYLDDNPTGTPADIYTIGLTLADNNAGTDTDSANVTINNAAPVLSNVSASPSIITAGQSTTFSGNVGDAGTLDPHDISINWGDGSPNTVLNLGAGVNFFNTLHTYNSIGTFNIAVTATDDDTGSTNAGAVLTVNTPPVLSNVAVTSPITENGTANLTGNITDANAGDAFSLAVNWGDGSPVQFFGYQAGTTAFNESHQYRDDNPTGTPSDNYTISLTLSDSRESDTDSAMVTVNNAPPVLQNLAATPSTINVGGITNVSGTVTDVGAFDTHQVVINWGDGSPNTTINLAVGIGAFNSNHQYNSSGNFNIGTTATDDDTGSVSGSVNLTVNPSQQQPPVLSNVLVSSPIIENGTATLTGNISDANAGDTFVLMINWGDGSATQAFNYPAGTTSFIRTHVYHDDNPSGTPSDNYTINLTLSDNAGGSDVDSAVVAVNNALPVLSNIAANPMTILPGGTTNLSGTITDVGTLDTHQIVINWGDGTPVTTINLAASDTAFSANHQYITVGTFNIAVTATDDDTGSATGAANVTVVQPTGGKIAFTSARDGNYEIYSMNLDGSNQTRLTNNAALDSYAAMSPDGNRIAFTSNRDGNNEIYIMNADGTGQTRVTNNPRSDVQPAFSYDGTRIVFVSVRDANLEIYVMNVDGTNQTRLTNNFAPDFEPTFSPDGTKVAFTSQRDGYGQVYLMNSDGTNQVRLTNAVADEYDPSFSPDGTRIAFSSFRHGPQVEIYAMNVDGTNHTRLTNNAAADISPSFSPDGGQLAFVSNRDGRLEVYVMNSDGSNQVRLTNSAPSNEYPSFGSFPAPSGKIAFASSRDGNYEIYSMNTNGTNQTRLTNDPALDYAPSLSADGSRIAFHSYRDGDSEVYVMNSDGTGQTRLTNVAGSNSYPAFSPDGSRIAFMSFRDGNFEIYVMNADGTNPTRVTNHLASDVAPAFSPDGSRIAFQSERDGLSEIYVMNSDGTNVTRLTNNSSSDTFPSFSPDGSRITFTSNRDGMQQIYVMNADGTNQIRLSTVFAAEYQPTFSPDGSQIAFASFRGGANRDVYRMNADGTNVQRLTSDPNVDEKPSWGSVPTKAPGRKIVFASTRDGNAEIYMMNSNGTNQVRLTNSASTDQETATSPDGSRIAFVSDRDGDFEIYVMNADGTNVTRLTDNAEIDTQPSFSPDGSRIVFTSTRDNASGEIYVMNSDGTGQIRLTNNVTSDYTPAFSPDGNRIAFGSSRSGAPGIFLMNANGANPTRLTDGYEPSFSPDGNRIAFNVFENGNFGVFVINTNGTNRVRLTSNLSSNFNPAFNPDGSQIAFESTRDGNYEIYLINADGSNQTRLTNNTANDFSPSWGGLVLAGPTNLTAVAVSTTQINLTWTDNSVGEDGFAIERCDGGGGSKCSVFVRIAGTSANVTAFANTALRPNTFYSYRVRAFSAGGDSPYSNTVREKTRKQ